MWFSSSVLYLFLYSHKASSLSLRSLFDMQKVQIVVSKSQQVISTFDQSITQDISINVQKMIVYILLQLSQLENEIFCFFLRIHKMSLVSRLHQTNFCACFPFETKTGRLVILPKRRTGECSFRWIDASI